MSKLIGEDLKMLILDDERDICFFSKKYFIKRGFDVRTALTGKAAVGLAKRIKPDIALLDIHLSDEKITGIDVLRSIREIKPDCHCIMVTRDEQKEKEDEARKSGASEYLTKLSTAKNLDKVISKIVKKIRKGVK